MTTETTTRRIYVACLGSYNEGRLHGRWIDATSDVDELNEQVQAMLAESKLDFGRKAEEYAIHDYEGYPSGLIGEYSGIAKIAEIEEALERLDHHPENAVLAFLGNHHDDLDVLEDFDDHFHGEWDSGADYAEDFYLSTHGEDALGPLSSYINWESVWRGEFHCGDYWTAPGDNGGVFIYS